MVIIDDLTLIQNTPNILYVCCNETGAAMAKLRKLKTIGKIKFYTKENDSIPTEIDWIFFDYHLISHGIYHKIKNIGKRLHIPMYNIQSIDTDTNISEMAQFIRQVQHYE